MLDRFLIIAIVAAFICCCSSYFGCTNKNHSDADARISADWVKDAVIYEVYLRSFSKEGTFKALEARISELQKLGINIILLMPIHPIGELNRRGTLGSPFAVKDFYAVNAEYGTLDDFTSLVNTVHRQGMKIIIGLVANQAAWDSQLLMEHPDWFVHNEEGAIISPHPELIDVAKLDYNQHEPRKYMVTMMKYWVKELGVDGFKCYGAESIPTDFWNVARKELDKIKPVVMISDGALPEYHLTAFDVTSSWNVYSILTNMMSDHTPVLALNDSLKNELYKFPKGSLHLRFITSYNMNVEDIPAVDKFGPQGAKAIAVLMFTIPGVPLIYNGEETGNRKLLDLFHKVEMGSTRGLNYYELYEQLSGFRRNHPALRNGSYMHMTNSESANVFSFVRSSGTDSVIVIINFAKEKKEINLQIPAGLSMMWKDQFSGVNYQAKDSYLNVTLLPLGYLILVPTTEREVQ